MIPIYLHKASNGHLQLFFFQSDFFPNHHNLDTAMLALFEAKAWYSDMFSDFCLQRVIHFFQFPLADIIQGSGCIKMIAISNSGMMYPYTVQ